MLLRMPFIQHITVRQLIFSQNCVMVPTISNTNQEHYHHQVRQHHHLQFQHHLLQLRQLLLQRQPHLHLLHLHLYHLLHLLQLQLLHHLLLLQYHLHLHQLLQFHQVLQPHLLLLHPNLPLLFPIEFVSMEPTRQLMLPTIRKLSWTQLLRMMIQLMSVSMVMDIG